jgi:hypothetical protein
VSLWGNGDRVGCAATGPPDTGSLCWRIGMLDGFSDGVDVLVEFDFVKSAGSKGLAL